MKLFNFKFLDNESEQYNFDVACGADIDMEMTKHYSNFRDAIYYFCSHECQKKFEDNPEQYIWDKL
ncbi:hypothetical protein CVV43_04520 [Candidatus Saccharibacteria bacterium HGW-Saccharibacteria-1]|jgi:YHS domain-containing protein|nr:MAG: hypothetical protein CVV43_04520 [Candidatus Saccharibacteria bacterium HGW-Saccharibacteria-1]